jgi:hypothetical protein|tara:strand:+ start:170 stop:505 length:336 start_codon:yes stop_codon:yes gene_type:complete
MRYLIISLGTLLVSCSIYAYLLRNDLTEAIESNIAYENSIAYQNLEIQRQRTDKEKALEKIKQWKALPAAEKWNTITKVIYEDVNINSEGFNCEENKIIENNVYNLDWNNF